MEIFDMNLKNSGTILALGAESAGNFSFFLNGKLYFSKNFGDLLIDENYQAFEKEVQNFLKKGSLKPSIVLCDLHPLFNTTLLAQKIAKKYGAKIMPVQHHLAHIFSAIGDNIINNPKKYKLKNGIGIACDGTGYGLDERIWGGEFFKLKAKSEKFETVRVGHLENQILIGSEMAIQQPARILIATLAKFMPKENVYEYARKYYSENNFNLLWNQLQQKFNCIETSSTARILDAVSVLLEFSKNERKEKHGPVALLEKNSTKPYAISPKISKKYDSELRVTSYELLTTPLFEYLIKNLHRDKKRLAATAQKYIADGLLAISNQQLATSNQKNNLKNKLPVTSYKLPVTFFAGGMANNKIISEILQKNGAYVNQKIPRGDAGISLGQISYFLLANPGD